MDESGVGICFVVGACLFLPEVSSGSGTLEIDSQPWRPLAKIKVQAGSFPQCSAGTCPLLLVFLPTISVQLVGLFLFLY